MIHGDKGCGTVPSLLCFASLTLVGEGPGWLISLPFVLINGSCTACTQGVRKTKYPAHREGGPWKDTVTLATSLLFSSCSNCLDQNGFSERILLLEQYSRCSQWRVRANAFRHWLNVSTAAWVMDYSVLMNSGAAIKRHLIKLPCFTSGFVLVTQPDFWKFISCWFLPENSFHLIYGHSPFKRNKYGRLTSTSLGW